MLTEGGGQQTAQDIQISAKRSGLRPTSAITACNLRLTLI